MKKLFLTLLIASLATICFSQTSLVCKVRFTSDSAGSETRKYYLTDCIKDFDAKEVKFKNLVEVTKIFKTDTIRYGYRIGYAIAKTDSIRINNVWVKAANYYNSFNISTDTKLNDFIKLNRQLIYNDPNRR